MKSSVACVLSLVFSAQLAFSIPSTRGLQAPLGQQVGQYNDFLSMINIPGQSLTESLSDFIMTSFSDGQREELMVKLWEQHDVVEIMRMTGNGDGLDEERLVQVLGEEEPRVMTEGDKLKLKKAGYTFMDITDHPDLGEINVRAPGAINISLSLRLSGEGKSSVKAMMKSLDDKHLRSDITKLSSFWNRSYRSAWGALSSNWIHDQVESILETVDKAHFITSVTKFSHKFPQNSVIARIETKNRDVEDKEIIVISAHQDSLNYKLPFYRAPGADDDGSGSVTILQVLRSMVEGKFTPPPHLALEFHWFAAEEGGLLGSQDVAAAYKESGKTIRGVLHMDMTAFVKNGTEPIIAFFDTNVDANLTSFATKLVDEYLPLKWNMTRCGNSCGSDHMSFTKAGYPAIIATEALFGDFPLDAIHTINDDMDQHGQYSFEHMLQFVKLGIAFIAELSAQ